MVADGLQAPRPQGPEESAASSRVVLIPCKKPLIPILPQGSRWLGRLQDDWPVEDEGAHAWAKRLPSFKGSRIWGNGECGGERSRASRAEPSRAGMESCASMPVPDDGAIGDSWLTGSVQGWLLARNARGLWERRKSRWAPSGRLLQQQAGRLAGWPSWPVFPFPSAYAPVWDPFPHRSVCFHPLPSVPIPPWLFDASSPHLLQSFRGGRLESRGHPGFRLTGLALTRRAYYNLRAPSEIWVEKANRDGNISERCVLMAAKATSLVAVPSRHEFDQEPCYFYYYYNEYYHSTKRQWIRVWWTDVSAEGVWEQNSGPLGSHNRAPLSILQYLQLIPVLALLATQQYKAMEVSDELGQVLLPLRALLLYCAMCGMAFVSPSPIVPLLLSPLYNLYKDHY